MDGQHHDKDVLLFPHISATKNKPSKVKKHGKKDYVLLTTKLLRRTLSMSDFFTDLALLQLFRKSELIYGFTVLMISIFAPYLISYSSGMKLFVIRGTFENRQGFTKLLLLLFASPIGVFYFIFIDFFDAISVYIDFFSIIFCCMNKSQIQQRQRIWAKQLGLDRMALESIKRQRAVGYVCAFFFFFEYQ